MSAYELISQFDSSLLDQMITKGLLRSTVKRDMEIYEFYLSQCNLGRMQARTNTAEKFYMSEDRISKIIQKMK
mgnify:CR=1 FL=1